MCEVAELAIFKGAREVKFGQFSGMANPGVHIHGKSIRLEFVYKGKDLKERFTSLADVETQQDFERKLMQANMIRENIRMMIDSNQLNDDFLKSLIPQSNFARKLGTTTSFGEVAEDYINSLEFRVRRAEFSPTSAKTEKRIANSKLLEEKQPNCPELTIKRRGFNALNIRDVKPKNITDFINYLQFSAEKEDGSVGYSAGYIKNVLNFIKQVFNHAIHMGVIEINPCLQVKTLRKPKSKGRVSKDGEKVDFFTLEQQTLVYDEFFMTQRRFLAEMFKFGCWSGLRKEELLALAWEDVDLHEKSIIVRRAQTDGFYKDTKTELGVRELGLIKPAFDAIHAMREFTEDLEPQIYRVQRSEDSGWVDEPLSLVFMNLIPRTLPGGEKLGARAWTESSLTKAWNKMRKETGVPHPISIVRHTYSSVCMSMGVDISVLSRTLGHASETMLRTRYGKIDKTLNPDVLKQINRILGFPDYG